MEMQLDYQRNITVAGSSLATSLLTSRAADLGVLASVLEASQDQFNEQVKQIRRVVSSMQDGSSMIDESIGEALWGLLVEMEQFACGDQNSTYTVEFTVDHNDGGPSSPGSRRLLIGGSGGNGGAGQEEYVVSDEMWGGYNIVLGERFYNVEVCPPPPPTPPPSTPSLICNAATRIFTACTCPLYGHLICSLSGIAGSHSPALRRGTCGQPESPHHRGVGAPAAQAHSEERSRGLLRLRFRKPVLKPDGRLQLHLLPPGEPARGERWFSYVRKDIVHEKDVFSMVGYSNCHSQMAGCPGRVLTALAAGAST